MLGRDRGRADDHLGAVRLEHVALVLADLVGADEDALVALAPGRPWPARRRCCRRSARRSCRRAGARPEASAASIIRVAIRSFTEPPGLRYSTLARTSGPCRAVEGAEWTSRQPQQRGVADEVEERVRRTASGQSRARIRIANRASPLLRRVEAWGKQEPHASWPPPPRTAAAGSPLLGRRAVRRARGSRPRLARKTIGAPRRRPAGRDRLVRPRPPRPGDQGRPARRLQRRRVRRRAGRGDPRRAAGQRAGRAGRPPGLPARVRRGRRRVLRPRRPGRPGAADRAGRRGDPDRRQRRHPHGAARRRRCATSPRRSAGSARPASRSLVGTCPDLGTIKPIAPPLKQVARTWSRRLAAAQTIAVVEEGGRTVSLGSILGPEFAAAPALLFGPDQFHPSADGYRSLAGVLLPSTLAALGLIADDEAQPEAFRGEGVLPIATAAVQAVNTPGTELDGTEVGGAPARRPRAVGRAAAPPPAARTEARGPDERRGPEPAEAEMPTARRDGRRAAS